MSFVQPKLKTSAYKLKEKKKKLKANTEGTLNIISYDEDNECLRIKHKAEEKYLNKHVIRNHTTKLQEKKTKFWNSDGNKKSLNLWK